MRGLTENSNGWLKLKLKDEYSKLILLKFKYLIAKVIKIIS
jgi:hypothetical protein